MKASLNRKVYVSCRTRLVVRHGRLKTMRESAVEYVVREHSQEVIEEWEAKGWELVNIAVAGYCNVEEIALHFSRKRGLKT